MSEEKAEEKGKEIKVPEHVLALAKDHKPLPFEST